VPDVVVVYFSTPVGGSVVLHPLDRRTQASYAVRHNVVCQGGASHYRRYAFDVLDAAEGMHSTTVAVSLVCLFPTSCTVLLSHTLRLGARRGGCEYSARAQPLVPRGLYPAPPAASKCLCV
jgi:hypothetical protein